LKREDDGTAAQERFEEIKVYEEIDERLGFWRFESGKAQGEEREGWLVNMHQVGRQSSVEAKRSSTADSGSTLDVDNYQIR
jgi:DNA polymerase epsilon subunit 1